MPFDVAFSAEPELRAAMCIRIGMFEGNVFDWEAGNWARGA